MGLGDRVGITAGATVVVLVAVVVVVDGGGGVEVVVRLGFVLVLPLQLFVSVP